jgi:membrane protein YqaA with SNARE-associated domain
MATKEPFACFVVATAGNWLGSITTYVLGRFAKWEWIEKVFKVSNEKLEAQKARIDKYGIWLALLSWVPFVGDVITLALGFYKTPWTWTLLLLLVGKAARFAVWMFLVGATIA